HRRRRKGCHARASSHEEGPGAPWRDSRATRTHPSPVRQRLPRRNLGGGHGATALEFGGSLLIYRPTGLKIASDRFGSVASVCPSADHFRSSPIRPFLGPPACLKRARRGSAR